MKEKIREKYRYIRKNIKNKAIKDEIIFNKIINNKKVNEADNILIYVSNKEEIDTIKIIEYFLNIKKVAVPKIENNIMNFYYINTINDLELGYFNILEPNTNNKVIDFNNTVSLTPGICFSKDLDRIGYGKGYYDKFYNNHEIYSIGLCYKECLLEKLEHSKLDKKVNEIITD